MVSGDVFGEMALVLYEPRAASVAAVDEVSLLVLDKHTLNEGLGIDGWTGALVRALANRFHDLEQQVRASGRRRGEGGRGSRRASHKVGGGSRSGLITLRHWACDGEIPDRANAVDEDLARQESRPTHCGRASPAIG